MKSRIHRMLRASQTNGSFHKLDETVGSSRVRSGWRFYTVIACLKATIRAPCPPIECPQSEDRDVSTGNVEMMPGSSRVAYSYIRYCHRRVIQDQHEHNANSSNMIVDLLPLLPATIERSANFFEGKIGATNCCSSGGKREASSRVNCLITYGCSTTGSLHLIA